jgi:hypothetical protein
MGQHTLEVPLACTEVCLMRRSNLLISTMRLLACLFVNATIIAHATRFAETLLLALVAQDAAQRKHPIC